MKKKRKKKGARRGLHPRGGLSTTAERPLALHCHYLGSFDSEEATGPSLTASLNCMLCCTHDLELLHESSFLCLDILAHSCCDLEVHVEELNTLCLRLPTCAPRAQCAGSFLQVSPHIPHRQGFRAH